MSKSLAGRTARSHGNQPPGALNAPNAQAAPGVLDHVPIRVKVALQVCLLLLVLALGASFLLLLPLVSFSELSPLQVLLIPGSIVTAALLCAAMFWLNARLFKGIQAQRSELEEVKAQLYHAHKVVSVGQLAGEIVHEINNPLAIIDSQSGVIRDMLDPSLGLDASPEALRKELDEIDKAVNRARGITHKILNFVRKSEPKIEECDVEQLLDEVAESMKGKEFQVSGIQVKKDYAANLPRLRLDPDLLQQVFLNLLNNAGDAMANGGVLTLKTETRGEQVRITIADTGAGMTQEQIEQSFQPFFTTKKAGKGTGLGLPICVNIVEGFGGGIEVDSAPGQGAAFTVALRAPAG